MKLSDAFRNFLNCTSCYNDKEIFWTDQNPDQDERFVIFKHKAHASYVDRCTGSVNCSVYYEMYDLNNIPINNSFTNCINYGAGGLLKFEGRWKKSNFKIVEDKIKEILSNEDI